MYQEKLKKKKKVSFRDDYMENDDVDVIDSDTSKENDIGREETLDDIDSLLDIRNDAYSNNTTRNATHYKAMSYTATTGVTDRIGVYLDCVIVDLIRKDDVSNTVWPAVIKSYFYWALLDRIRSTGNFGGVYGATMPKFPSNAFIPKALFALFKYIAPYDYFGTKYSPEYYLNFLPTFSYLAIGNFGDGLTYSPAFCVGLRFTDIVNNYENCYDTAIFGSLNMNIGISGWTAVSEWISRNDCAMPYSDLPKVAPDASFYTWCNDTRPNVYCVSPDFNVVFGWIFASTLPTDYCPMFRKRLPDFYGDFGSTQNPWGLIMGCVTVCNRMDPKSLKVKNGWNWMGHRLVDPYAIYLRYDPKCYTTLLAMTAVEIAVNSGNLQFDDELFCSGIIWRAIFNKRFTEFGSLCINNASLPIQMFLTANEYMTIKIPLVLGAVIESIGPYVAGKNLYIPDLDYVNNSYVNNATIYSWPSAGNNIGQFNDNTMSLLATVFGFQPGPVLWDAAYFTRSISQYQVLWPVCQLPFIQDIYTKMCWRLGVNNTITLSARNMGELNMLCDSIVVSEQTLGVTPNTRIPQFTFRTWKTNLFQFNGTICSNYPIGSKDLMMALFFCRNISSTGFDTTPPFIYSDPNSGNGFDGYIRIKQILKDTMSPTSEFSIEIGKIRSRMSVETVSMGTLEVGLKSNNAWWYDMWNRWMRDASYCLSPLNGGIEISKIVKKLRYFKNVVASNFNDTSKGIILPYYIWSK